MAEVRRCFYSGTPPPLGVCKGEVFHKGSPIPPHCRCMSGNKKENDNAIEFSKVVVFDQTNNAMLAFVPGEKIKFGSPKKVSIQPQFPTISPQ